MLAFLAKDHTANQEVFPQRYTWTPTFWASVYAEELCRRSERNSSWEEKGKGVGLAKTRRGRREKEENNNKDGALTPLLNFKGYCKL